MQIKAILVTVARFLVGGLFLLSGYLKLVDPKGFAYKLEEYFSPQVFDLEFLIPFSLTISIFLVLLEVVLGLFLLFGIFKKFTFWSILSLIIFFTFLTFYSAFYNKVTDCGCFGDAIKLTPWESFYKDVFLLFLILIIGWGIQFIKPLLSTKIAALIVALVVGICLWIINMGVNHLPIQDFRPFAVGVNIPNAMAVPADAPRDSIQRIWKYKVNGKLSEYSDADEPWSLPNAEYVSREDKVIKKGFEPKIKPDFLFSCDGEDQTQHYLNQEKLAMLIVPMPDQMESKDWKKAFDLGVELQSNGIEVVLVASNTIAQSQIPACTMDATMLKTIIRSNPGIMLLSNGDILAKYHHNDLPTLDEVNTLFTAK